MPTLRGLVNANLVKGRVVVGGNAHLRGLVIANANKVDVGRALPDIIPHIHSHC